MHRIEAEHNSARRRSAPSPLVRELRIGGQAPAVRHTAGRLAIWFPDLLGDKAALTAGVLGLVRALGDSDGDDGQFAARAAGQIRESILEFAQQRQPASTEAARRARAIDAAIESLVRDLGRAPEEEEIRARLGWDAADLGRLIARTLAALLPDHPAADTDTMPLADVLGDAGQGPSERPARGRQRRELEAALERLPARDRLVISLYHHEGLTLKEMAEVLGQPAPRVGEWYALAVFRLRGLLRAARRVTMITTQDESLPPASTAPDPSPQGHPQALP